MGVSKESISKFLIGNRFRVKNCEDSKLFKFRCVRHCAENHKRRAEPTSRMDDTTETHFPTQDRKPCSLSHCA